MAVEIWALLNYMVLKSLGTRIQSIIAFSRRKKRGGQCWYKANDLRHADTWEPRLGHHTYRSVVIYTMPSHWGKDT